MKMDTFRIILCIGWFICGLIGAIINHKKYRTKKEIEENDIRTDLIFFIWGYIGLFFIFFRWLNSKIMKI